MSSFFFTRLGGDVDRCAVSVSGGRYMELGRRWRFPGPKSGEASRVVPAALDRGIFSAFSRLTRGANTCGDWERTRADGLRARDGLREASFGACGAACPASAPIVPRGGNEDGGKELPNCAGGVASSTGMQQIDYASPDACDKNSAEMHATLLPAEWRFGRARRIELCRQYITIQHSTFWSA